MRKHVIIGSLFCWTVLSVACGNAGSDRVTSVESFGRVDGGAFFDANGNKVFDTGDTTMPGVVVQLVTTSSRDTVVSQTTDPMGTFVMTSVPVGDYLVEVDTSSLGDSVDVAFIDQPMIQVSPFDSITVAVAISYPFSTTDQIRTLTVGTKVFLVGVALNSLASFGDTTVNVADSAGSLRTTRVRPIAILVSDSVRFLGRRGSRTGQPTLDDVQPFPVGLGVLPTAVLVTSDEASDARGGALDAVLVRTVNLTVSDTATTVDGDFIATADDGSGPVEVFFSRFASISVGGVVPGALIDITGLLVPFALGDWQLKPRSQTDLLVK